MEKLRAESRSLVFHLTSTSKELSVVANDPAHNLDASEDVESLKKKVAAVKEMGEALSGTDKEMDNEIAEINKEIDECMSEIESKLRRTNQFADLKVVIADDDDHKSDEEIESPAEYIDYISSCLAELNEDVKEIEEELLEYTNIPDFVDLSTRQKGLEGLAAIRLQLHDLEESKFQTYQNEINQILLNRGLEPSHLKKVKTTLQKIEKRIQEGSIQIIKSERRIESSLDEYLRTASSWQNPEVLEWLECQGLGKFLKKFEESNVVGSMLLNDLDIDVLRDHFELSKVHARHLLREIGDLKEKINEQEAMMEQQLASHLTKQLDDLTSHENNLLVSRKIMEDRIASEKKSVKDSFDEMLKSAFAKIDDSFSHQKSRIEDELKEVRTKIQSLSNEINGIQGDTDMKSKIFNFICNLIDQGELDPEEEDIVMRAYFKQFHDLQSIFEATSLLKNASSASKYFVSACKALS